MRRIWLLTSMALMLAAAMALSGVAQAKPITNGKAGLQCMALAIRTLGPSFNPSNSNYNFVGGTAGDDRFDRAATAGPDVFCGFGGNDSILALDVGDIFLGGDGNDAVTNNNGTFYGGAGDDTVANNGGTFYGGAGDENLYNNEGTFYGEAGNDFVTYNYNIVYGGDGNDSVGLNYLTFYGEGGYDSVTYNNGTFYQD